MDERLLQHLREFDTPTICNAIEDAQGHRSTEGFTRGHTMIAAFPHAKPIVGFAKTATIRASAPSSLDKAAARALRLAYYDYAQSEPRPTLVVIQDLDETPGTGAFWGEVNTAIHKGLGVEGCVTNGSIRDLDMVAPGFQLIAGSIGPSHAFVHLVEIKVPVTIYGMRVNDGDLVHADRHGATVIPRDLIARMPESIDRVIRQEKPILAAARSDGFDVAMLARAMAEADEIH